MSSYWKLERCTFLLVTFCKLVVLISFWDVTSLQCSGLNCLFSVVHSSTRSYFIFSFFSKTERGCPTKQSTSWVWLYFPYDKQFLFLEMREFSVCLLESKLHWKLHLKFLLLSAILQFNILVLVEIPTNPFQIWLDTVWKMDILLCLISMETVRTRYL